MPPSSYATLRATPLKRPRTESTLRTSNSSSSTKLRPTTPGMISRISRGTPSGNKFSPECPLARRICKTPPAMPRSRLTHPASATRRGPPRRPLMTHSKVLTLATMLRAARRLVSRVSRTRFRRMRATSRSSSLTTTSRTRKSTGIAQTTTSRPRCLRSAVNRLSSG